MSEQAIISLGSLFVTLVSVVITYILQRDIKNVREIERENKRLKSNLVKSLIAIQGYQLLEIEYAKEKNIEVSKFRVQIRKDKSEYFDGNFLVPSNINRLLENNGD